MSRPNTRGAQLHPQAGERPAGNQPEPVDAARLVATRVEPAESLTENFDHRRRRPAPSEEVPVSEPAIDPVWLAGVIASITSDLELRHPQAGAGEVRAAVDTAADRLSPPARIANYLPVLIRRAAEETLSAHPVGEFPVHTGEEPAATR